ncbi:MAG: hypothetical protein PWR00_329 [Thermovirga sp.]|nr:hypothetical protein [Thermovirga sp.]
MISAKRAKEPKIENKGKLINSTVLFLCLLVSLTIPNVIFSGAGWYQSLHLMKWAVAFAPIALAAAWAGTNMLLKGKKKLNLEMEPFGVVWLFLILFLTVQPLWAPITSVPTFVREWFFFAALWITYFLTYHDFDNRKLVILLWFGALNAALNVIFAELQYRDLIKDLWFILPTPGKYIGNTGQQNMLGLWVAMMLFSSSFMFLFKRGGKVSQGLQWANIVILFLLSWGLWNTTSRSAILSFVVGFGVLLLTASRLKEHISVEGRVWKRAILLGVILVTTLVGTILYGRGGAFLDKANNMLTQVEEVGKRDSIWATALTMFKMHPLTGVGLGHFKWNYLEAQKEMLKVYPGKEWKFTLWAHNEIFQWFCETGLFGGMVLVALGGWWLWCFARAVLSKKALSLEALWACGLLFLIWFDALWTRPFHRIEDALWMAFAFAIANREILPKDFQWTKIRRDYMVRALGGAILCFSLLGIFSFGGAMVADKLMVRALRSKDPEVARRLLEEAQEHLMVQDLAEKLIAYHYLEKAKYSGNVEDLVEGINRLQTYFNKEPQSRELYRLIYLYKAFGDKKMLDSLIGYANPSSLDEILK